MTKMKKKMSGGGEQFKMRINLRKINRETNGKIQKEIERRSETNT